VQDDGDVMTCVDDVYIDRTRARVEIGNASSWETCTRREIQLPTAWSATSVTIDVNAGRFVADDEAWVYVVNAAGEYNYYGVPVTIGGEPAGSGTGTPVLTRSGADLDLTWTLATNLGTVAYSVIHISEKGILDTGYIPLRGGMRVDGAENSMDNIPVTSTADLSVTVTCFNADGSASTSKAAIDKP